MLQPTTSKSHLHQTLWRTLPVIALMFASVAIAHAQATSTQTVKNIVLVHGGFVDGSGWEGVYKILTKKGYHVTVVQNPTISLEGDVAVTKRAIDAMNGPVILVGHSYGGAVISQAGTDPNVAGLVYITAFALDNGESVGALIKSAPAGAPAPPILPPQDGFLLLDPEKFPAVLCGRRKARGGRIHGHLAGSVGAGSREWHRHECRLENQAELVSRYHGRSYDPARRSAWHGQARRFNGRRGQGQPLRVPFPPRCGGVSHRAGSRRRACNEHGHEVVASLRTERPRITTVLSAHFRNFQSPP